MKSCTFDQCEGNAFGLGYCQKHYRRLKRHDDPAVAADNRHHLTQEARTLALQRQAQGREADRALLQEHGLQQHVQVRVRHERTRFNGRKGTVSAFTIQRFEFAPPYLEVGVSFDGGSYPNAWFLPTELEKLA